MWLIYKLATVASLFKANKGYIQTHDPDVNALQCGGGVLWGLASVRGSLCAWTEPPAMAARGQA